MKIIKVIWYNLIGDIMDELVLKEIIEILKIKKYKISFCESCTGGMLVSTLVSISGTSNVLEESYVTYSEDAKKKILGVNEKTIEKYTVYSKEVSKEMALGLKKISSSDVNISITGHAGGDENKDNGVAYFTIIIGDNIYENKIRVDGNRDEVRKKFTENVFKTLHKLLKNM